MKPTEEREKRGGRTRLLIELLSSPSSSSSSPGNRVSPFQSHSQSQSQGKGKARGKSSRFRFFSTLDEASEETFAAEGGRESCIRPN